MDQRQGEQDLKSTEAAHGRTEPKHDYKKVIELLRESITDTDKALEEVEKKAQRLS
jgi:hypothetical protein